MHGPQGLKDLFSQPAAVPRAAAVSARRSSSSSRASRSSAASTGSTTFAVDHGVSAVGYALVEHERPGRFDVDAADALGVPPGRSGGSCRRGEPVTLADGRGDHARRGPRSGRDPGRKVVLTGDTAPSPTVVQAAHDADLLVHEATFAAEEKERARETLHATAAEAAEVARLADVRLLALTHVSTRYFGS